MGGVIAQVRNRSRYLGAQLTAAGRGLHSPSPRTGTRSHADNSGGHATMLQRKPTVIVSLASANAGFAQCFTGISLTEGDLFSAANFVLPLMREALKAGVRVFKEQYREIIEGLERVGFKHDYGEDNTGFVLKFYNQRGGGYYFILGGSEAIADGRIALIQNENVDGFVADGLRLADGSVLPLDAVVSATGYQGPESEVVSLLGTAIVDRAGRVGGLVGLLPGYEASAATAKVSVR